MKALILAAGLGTRLRPLTEKTPKPLLPVAGRPMILYPLAFLRGQGIREVIINIHLQPDQWRQALGDGSRLGLHITFSPEPVLLDTGGGIKNAEKFFRGEALVVLNADTLIELDLDQVLKAHRRHRPAATLVLKQLPNPAEFSPVLVDAQGRVRRLRGEPAEIEAAGLQAFTFTGLQILEPEILDALPAGVPACLIRDAYIPLLRAGREIRAFLMEGYWKSLDTADRIHEAEADLQAGRLPMIA